MKPSRNHVWIMSASDLLYLTGAAFLLGATAVLLIVPILETYH